MTERNPVVAKRVFDLEIRMNDFVSLFADQRNPEIHAQMLEGLLQTIKSWESDDFDWPKHVCKVVGALSDTDEEAFKTLLETLQEPYSSIAQDVLIELLRTALADSIRRPMGVMPDSAEGLLTQEDLEAAEQRRLGFLT